MSHRVELEREDYEALCERAANATDPDRERIEFIRRAAIAYATAQWPSRYTYDEQGSVEASIRLWDALQKAGC